MSAAEDDARGILRLYWADPLDLSAIPVDPIKIANRLGIAVYEERLADGVSGKLVKRAHETAVISINRDDALVRQRFTCAHELGHYFQRMIKSRDEAFAFVDHRAHLAGLGVAESEVYANAFAAALLMPHEILKGRLEAGLGPSALSKYFVVSEVAMRYRIQNTEHLRL